MSREQVMADVRAALADVTEPDPLTDVPRVWQTGRATLVDDALELFVDRLIDYKAEVVKAPSAKVLPNLIAVCLHSAHAISCCVPPGLAPELMAPAAKAGIDVRTDDPPLSKGELDGIDAVVTMCRACMAETGTIALDHSPDQGRRVISLLPDIHVCIVKAAQIASDVPEAMALLERPISQGQPITWISGPSATSDIELSRVEGVHGPRKLYVIIVP
jgi:L-lactate dehydrogenase complex protein LldG